MIHGPTHTTFLEKCEAEKDPGCNPAEGVKKSTILEKYGPGPEVGALGENLERNLIELSDSTRRSLMSKGYCPGQLPIDCSVPQF